MAISKFYLQNIVDDISFENLPAQKQGFDLSVPTGAAQAGHNSYVLDITERRDEGEGRFISFYNSCELDIPERVEMRRY